MTISNLIRLSLCILTSMLFGLFQLKSQNVSEKSLPEIQSAEQLIIEGVNVISMLSDAISYNQNVYISKGVIDSIIPSKYQLHETDPTTLVINGKLKFLIPGLMDAHAHIDEVFTGEFYSDAPIYLSYGVTSLINLNGNKRILDFRNGLSKGSIEGWYPRIFTAGNYINEPFFTSPMEVENEVIRQVEAGFDLIKTHGSLSSESFERLHNVSNKNNIPVIGHAPRNLSISEVWKNKHNLAHGEEFMYTAFQPIITRQWQILFFAGILSLIALVIIEVFHLFFHLILKKKKLHRFKTRFYSGKVILAHFVFILLFLFSVPPVNGYFFDSVLVRIVLILLLFSMGILFFKNVNDVKTIKTFRYRAINLLVLLLLVSSFYLTVQSCKTLPWYIDKVATKAKEAEIFVCPNLTAYHYIALHHNDSLLKEIRARKEMNLINSYSKEWWDREAQTGRNIKKIIAKGFIRQKELLNCTTRALFDQDVPLLAGTDTGIPWVIPGRSMHEELEFLADTGIPPYEALKTATLNVAQFLKKDSILGTIEKGKYADLVLLDANPLDNITNSQKISAVIYRGQYISSEMISNTLSIIEENNN
ncbi:amidohydrolase family protein [Muricauda sp. JGD-17]|uniref:Amidohydrolase family protein n=1 Tax=Flagellimonas ochracea TaxID=2696472 RepID=A0A964WYD7_9FLAO|nr:amidohydrolase family protein [Allomuricauda ochracea]NAY93116.1 amidohydrolase family protein [Allomuricauda ochracea]